MVENKESNDKNKENKEPKNFDELREKIEKKEKNDSKDIIKQITTRGILERDYKEDLLKITFYSSPETKRTVKSRRPTQEEMIIIMKLSAEASMYEGKLDSKSLQKMVSIYESLPKLAAKLCVDPSLDEKFWRSNVSFTTLQNFIAGLIKATQEGPLEEDQLQSFR